MKYLGVDPGGRRLGLAQGDDSTRFVFPAGIYPYQGVENTAAWLLDEAQQRGVDIIVMGLPTTERGEETPACRRSRALAEALAKLGSRVAFQPEFLSSHEAKARAHDLGRPRGTAIDDLAAQIILEDFFAGLPAQAAPAR